MDFPMSTSVCRGRDAAQQRRGPPRSRSAEVGVCMRVSVCTCVCPCLCMSILHTPATRKVAEDQVHRWSFGREGSAWRSLRRPQAITVYGAWGSYRAQTRHAGVPSTRKGPPHVWGSPRHGGAGGPEQSSFWLWRWKRPFPGAYSGMPSFSASEVTVHRGRSSFSPEGEGHVWCSVLSAWS